MQGTQPQGNVLRTARIAKTYPAYNCVDLVFIDDGGVAKSVPVMSGSPQSQDHGESGLPDVEEPEEGGKWSSKGTDKQDMMCVVAMAGGTPIVMGFVRPPKESMGLDRENGDGERIDKNARVAKHPSGTNTYTDGNGNKCYRHGPGLTQTTRDMDDDKFSPPKDNEDRNKKWKEPEEEKHIEVTGGAKWGDETGGYEFRAEETAMSHSGLLDPDRPDLGVESGEARLSRKSFTAEIKSEGSSKVQLAGGNVEVTSSATIKEVSKKINMQSGDPPTEDGLWDTGTGGSLVTVDLADGNLMMEAKDTIGNKASSMTLDIEGEMTGNAGGTIRLNASAIYLN